MQKYRLTESEIALVQEGLAAGARENARLAEDARRLGYHAQAQGFARKADEFRALSSTASSVRVQRLTARY